MNKIFTLLLFIFLTSKINAQVAIASSNTAPNASAMLDVQSTNRGLLIPRMTSMQRTTIATPANGLLVFDTDSLSIMMNTVSGWVRLQSTTDLLWKKLGDNIYNSNSGNVGIGTQNPKAKLHVMDSSVVFTGSPTVLFSYNKPPISGAGSRMMWYSDKNAFRVGYVDADQWNKDSIGLFSFAGGYNSVAKGYSSFAFGDAPRSTGSNSVAIGNNVLATEDWAVALGGFSEARGRNSLAFGAGVAIGSNSLAGGPFSKTYGSYGVALGNTISKSYGGFCGGFNNDTTDNPHPGIPNSTDRIFQIGNGNTTASIRSNAITILRNANTGIGNINNPTEKLEVAGAIKISDATASPSNGTIRYTATDGFQGMHAGSWQNLTGGGVGGTSPWVANGNNISNTNSGAVSIGSSSTINKFSVTETSASSSATTVYISNGNSGVLQPTGIKTGLMSSMFEGNAMYGVTTNGSGVKGHSMQGEGVWGIGTTNTSVGVKGQTDYGVAGYFQVTAGAPGNGYALLATGGNVGFGLLNPSQQLEVAGAIKIADANASPTNGTIRYTTSAGFQGMHGGSWLNLTGIGAQWTTNGNNISNSNTGNVGIGVTNPSQKLEIAGAIKIENMGVGVNPVNGIIAYNGTDFLGYHNGWKSLTSGSYTAGSGINISSNVISTIPQTLSLSGNTLSIANGNSVSLPSGSSSSYWDFSNNNIVNNNSGKILMGDAPFMTSSFTPRFQIRDNTTTNSGGQNTLATITQVITPYSIALAVADSGTSGNPKGSPLSGQPGNVGIQGFSKYGDAFYGYTENGRGLYVYGGNIFGNPTALLEHKSGAGYTALKTLGGIDITGSIKIVDGTQAAGKVLTSDAAGTAFWQTPTAGTNYTAGTGININGSSISTNLVAGSGINITGNTIASSLTAGSGITITGNTISTTAANTGWNVLGDTVMLSGNLSNSRVVMGESISYISDSVRLKVVGSDAMGYAAQFVSGNINPAKGTAIKTNGRLAINKSFASEDLETNGAIVIGGGSAAITPTDGTVQNSGNDLQVYFNGSGWKSLTSADLWDRTTAGSVKLNNPSDNLGVGTYTIPTEKLEVNGGVKIGYSSNTNAGTIRFDGTNFEGYDGTNWKTFGSALLTNGTTNYISNLNTLGLGTDNANAKLHIKNNSNSFFPNLLIEEEGLFAPTNIQLKNAGSSNYWGINTYNSNSASASYFTINNNGTSIFSMTADGNATLTGTLTQNSDKRLKKNIQPLNNVLGKLNKLNGYSYNWIDDKKERGLQIGFLAQEVQEQFPQLVKQDEKGTLSVAYGNMVPILLQAIKEQQLEINELKQVVIANNSIKKIEQENAQLKNQLSELLKKFEELEKGLNNKTLNSLSQAK